jgi:hypothetical protein
VVVEAAAVVLLAVVIADAGLGAVLAAFLVLAIPTRRLINPLGMRLAAAREPETAN